ncbi:hypothetical protein BUALT_BualtUnG0026100 [Buddleja alternifolia]|uniref:Uncharacterized protein n=1 Tax=Buddleja alternifolia TaxID=168488 RepID=A0AAV6W3M8_9LAMI|nr:hypothetical protein BUALT_BualtUnG0026100 [Buddleja alternifolia]
MAMSFVIRKTSPTVVPLALRAISISSARVVLPESGSFRSHQFSTVAVDKKLVKVLKSEIKSMKRTRSQVSKSLIESTKVKPIVLRKEDNNDESDTLINKDSSTNDDKSDTDNDNDSSSDTDNNDNSSSTDSTSNEEEEEKENDNANPSLVGVPLKVRILKKDGSSAMNIRVLGCADEIIVENIEIYASGSPDGISFSDYQCALKFKELATDLQNSVKEFIGARGIDKTNVEFLLKYMISNAEFALVQSVQENGNLRSKIVESPDKLQSSHDWNSSFINNNGGGDSGEQNFRQPWSPASPPSSNAFDRKKLKLGGYNNGGTKLKPPKVSLKKSSSSNPEELEIEIAEVLFGLKIQSQVVPSSKKDDSKSLIRTPSNASLSFSCA